MAKKKTKDSITISRKEYEGMKETIEILQDKAQVKKILKKVCA